MALRILLSSGRGGNAVVPQRCKTGTSGLLKSCFSTPIIINTIHHWRGYHFSRAEWLAGRTKGICFSHHPKDSYIFKTIDSATIMDPQNNIEIVSIAQFAVNEHNSEREDDEAEEVMAEKGAKGNLRFVEVLEARLEYDRGITKFIITFCAVDEEDCAGGLTKRYKAIVSQSTTNGVLTLNSLGPNSTPFQDEFINGDHRYGKEAVKMH
ncbi:hypothetical protein RHSIM_Rhsim01G0004400 [Rhododendron simsii]|uniref:Uncharacterized protein n=1 Tax=Rhododendron simsii TaxID=118357 RepID=A0A834HK29_RHOSS|nr:hypothetical protein RHSIM_Rhsim01G0004400 [Rhododendron simsii]